MTTAGIIPSILGSDQLAIVDEHGANTKAVANVGHRPTRAWVAASLDLACCWEIADIIRYDGGWNADLTYEIARLKTADK